MINTEGFTFDSRNASRVQADFAMAILKDCGYETKVLNDGNDYLVYRRRISQLKEE